MAAALADALAATRISSVAPAGFPLRTAHTSALLPSAAAAPTQAILVEFANAVLLLVTQTGKVGSMSVVTMDAPLDPGSSDAPLTTVDTVLGARDDVFTHALASHIMSLLSSPPSNSDSAGNASRGSPMSDIAKPLILGLSVPAIHAVASQSQSVQSIDTTNVQASRKAIFDDIIKLVKDLVM